MRSLAAKICFLAMDEECRAVIDRAFEAMCLKKRVLRLSLVNPSYQDLAQEYFHKLRRLSEYGVNLEFFIYFDERWERILAPYGVVYASSNPRETFEKMAKVCYNRSFIKN